MTETQEPDYWEGDRATPGPCGRRRTPLKIHPRLATTGVRVFSLGRIGCSCRVVNVIERLRSTMGSPAMKERVLSALAQGATLVTANRRLCRKWRADFDAAQQAAGHRTWASPLIVSYDDWLHDEEDEDRIIGRKRVRFYVCRYGGASFVVVAVRFYVVYVQ